MRLGLRRSGVRKLKRGLDLRKKFKCSCWPPIFEWLYATTIVLKKNGTHDILDNFFKSRYQKICIGSLKKIQVCHGFNKITIIAQKPSNILSRTGHFFISHIFHKMRIKCLALLHVPTINIIVIIMDNHQLRENKSSLLSSFLSVHPRRE